MDLGSAVGSRSSLGLGLLRETARQHRGLTNLGMDLLDLAQP